jgi:TRAP-type C4-dicarboxylate transport system permease small subunit
MRGLFVALDAVVKLLVLSIVFLVAFQVFMRFVMNDPSVWSEEAALVAFVYLIFLGTGLAASKGLNLSADVISGLLRPVGQRRLRGVLAAITIAFLCVVFFTGIRMSLAVRGSTTTSLGIPMALVYASVPIGALVYALGVIVWLREPPAAAPEEQVG